MKQLTTTTNEPAALDRIERFQALQSGQYWRALGDIPHEGIGKGTVLLIQSVRWVDDAPHTVILRPHPTKLGTDTELKIPQLGGKTRTEWFRYEEHRFLLNDFLAAFEFEPDHQAIRAAELQQVQARINALQAELLQTQSNPALLAAIVEQEMRAQADPPPRAKRAGKAKASALPPQAGLPAVLDPSLVSQATGTVVAAIGGGITPERISAMKAAVEREHQIATVKAQWIQSKTEEIAETIQAITPFYAEQAAAALAQTEDVRSYVSKLLRGIESLDLYVGKDVEVHTLREGAPAPRDVPLTFVQRKLLMDEELAVWADVDARFDFECEDRFFEALRGHDGLVEQIFPTPRCVLVMAVTRRYIDYGDTWANNARNTQNSKVFLLVRDGMNIHRVFSPVESHLGAERLFPVRDDQDRIFRGFDGTQIKFEDVAYTDKLAQHERFALHYKRFLLLACGLDHRLKLFGEFYDGPPTFGFVSLAFQERHCRFLHDDDAGSQLPGEERPTVQAWIEEKNAYLRSGSRVLCNWRELMNPDTAPSACRAFEPDRNGRHSFEQRYKPAADFAVAIAYKSGSGTCVDVDVSGYSYHARDDRAFTCKVTLTQFRRHHWRDDDLPFLCLDAVEPEDLRAYIHSRASRRDHLDYIRFFKRALRHIEAERAEERDTRERLAAALAAGQIATAEERPAIVKQAVIAWRAANRGKPLPRYKDGAAPAAWNSLLDQMFLLAGEGKRRTVVVEDFVRELGYEPLRLVLSGDAKLVVYAAPQSRERDDRLLDHTWVHRIALERVKGQYGVKSRRWADLPKQAASETTVHEWPEAEQWAGRSSARFGTFDRKAQMFDATRDFRAALEPFTRPMSEAEHARQFAAWQSARAAVLRTARHVQEPELVIPFGLAYYPNSTNVTYLCIGSYRPHAILYRLAPNRRARDAIRAAFIAAFANKEAGAERFDAEIEKDADWLLLEAAAQLAAHDGGPFIHSPMPMQRLDSHSKTPLLADWFAGWQRTNRSYARTWLAVGALGDDGRLVLDALLGIELPKDFEALRVLEIRVEGAEGAFDHWFDICPADKDSPASEDEPSELDTLVATVVPREPSSVASTCHYLSSRREARDYIMERAEARGGGSKAVRSNKIPRSPRPPASYERWYVVAGSPSS